MVDYVADSAAGGHPDLVLDGAPERFGNYMLFDRVGDGGFAEVFVAAELGDDGEPTLVVKRLHEHLENHPESVDMFVTEARLMAEFDHENIVHVHYLERIEGRWSMIMERIDCDSLGEIFDFSLRIMQPIPLAAGVWICARIARALDYSHQRVDAQTGDSLGIVHRDIKPDNILLGWDGDVKLTDFGCAKASIQQELTRPGVRKGTLDYMSPEQCLGQRVDLRSDVFSLGIVLYEMVTFKRLYGDRNDARVMERIAHEVTRPPSWENADVNASLDLIVLRSLEKASNDRFETAGDLARALEWWLDRYISDDPVDLLTTWLHKHYRAFMDTSGRYAKASAATPALGDIELRAPSNIVHAVASRRSRDTANHQPSVPQAVSRARSMQQSSIHEPGRPAISRVGADQGGDRDGAGVAAVLTEERFRALQQIIARHSNLAPESTAVVGRTDELVRIDKIFRSGMQLVSLHGPAGIGKSTVARTYGRQRLKDDRPSGGVWLCDATRDESEAELCQTVAGVLGLPSSAAFKGDEAGQIGEALSARGPMLLIVDGLDSARRRVERVFERWIQAAPELEVIVTSVASMGSMRAALLAVPPLSLPESEADLEAAESVQVLLVGAQAIRPDYRLHGDQRRAVFELVHTLSGNPQALEIAAAQLARGDVSSLSRQSHRSPAPTGALSHETLLSAVAWSWGQLHPDEQAAFAISSVFHGGFSREAAVAVVGPAVADDTGMYVMEVLNSLQQRSLIQAYEPGDNPGTVRYRVVRVAQGFARERLIDRNDGALAMKRHADFLLAFAERKGPECFLAGGLERLRDLRLELPNLNAIQHRALRVQPPTIRSATRALSSALSLEPIAILRSRYDEHAKLLDKALAASERLHVDPALLARALLARVRASLALGGTRDDERMVDAATVLAEVDGDVRLLGQVESARGRHMMKRRKLNEARKHFQRAVKLLQATNSPLHLGLAYVGLGETNQINQRLETAESCLVAAQKLFAKSGHQHAEAVATADLGRVRLDLDYPAKAGVDLRWAQRVFRAFNDKRREAAVLLDLGRMQRQVGEFEVAERHFRESLDIARQVGNEKLEKQARKCLESVAQKRTP